MAVRIIVGLITLLAIIQGLAGDPIGGGILTLLLVILGLVYGALGVDAEDATAYLVVTLAAGGAASMNVLDQDILAVVGDRLDAILDQAVIALFAGAVTVLVTRAINRLKG